MAILFTNNASSTLANTLTSGATTAVVASGEGALFPTPTGSDVFYATLEDSSGNIEIIQCTARSTDSLTIVRAQEGTTAREFASGSRIEIRLTAGVLNALLQESVFNAGSVTAGDGLTGGGAYDTNPTITLGAPGTLDDSSTNSVTATSHTHQVDFPEPIPSGTIMLFQQTNAPTGWTKITSYNNRALRVVNGAVGTGGSVPFSTAFNTRTVSGSISSGGSHSHTAGTYVINLQRGRFDDSSGDYRPYVAGPAGISGAPGGTENVSVTGTSGSGGSHTHTFSGTNIDLSVQYVDIILASKD